MRSLLLHHIKICHVGEHGLGGLLEGLLEVFSPRVDLHVGGVVKELVARGGTGAEHGGGKGVVVARGHAEIQLQGRG